MSTQIQRRRGTTAEHSTFTGVEGEITVDTTKDTVVVHDGATVGGHPLQKQYPALGSAAAPTYTFTGDTNTGIYSPGADQLALSTSGTGRLFVDASGNVGVGVSNPGDYDSGSDDFVVGRSGNAGITIAAGTSSFSRLQFADGTGASTYRGFLMYSHADDDMRIGTAGAERLRITSAGLVGIGTSTPDSPLQVIGNTPAHFRRTSAGFCNVLMSASTAQWSTGVHSDGYYAITHEGVGERLRIDSSGRVGIGTTSPTSDLSFGSSAAVISSDTSDGADNKSVTLTGGGAGGVARGGYIVVYGNEHATSPGGVLLRTGSNAGSDLTIAARSSTSSVIFETNSTEVSRIDSSGRLLVGTSSTSQLFGGSAITGMQIEKSGNSATRSLALISNASANFSASLYFGRSGGTSNGAVTSVASGDSLGGISWGGADGTTAFIGAAGISAEVDGTPGTNDMPGRLVFSTTADGASSPTERMRIVNSGQILLNTTDSTAIHAARSIVFTLAQNGDIAINHSTANGTGDVYARFGYNGTQIGSITQNGTTAVAYNTSSDYRLKENVTPVTDGINRLQQLKPSRFNFIADPNIVVDGFIAHEVQTVVPEAITGEKDAVDDEGNPQYQGIDQSKLVPLLTAALQEAIGEIETLKARVAALETP